MNLFPYNKVDPLFTATECKQLKIKLLKRGTILRPGDLFAYYDTELQRVALAATECVGQRVCGSYWTACRYYRPLKKKSTNKNSK